LIRILFEMASQFVNGAGHDRVVGETLKLGEKRGLLPGKPTGGRLALDGHVVTEGLGLVVADDGNSLRQDADDVGDAFAAREAAEAAVLELDGDLVRSPSDYALEGEVVEAEGLRDSEATQRHARCILAGVQGQAVLGISETTRPTGAIR